MAEWLKEWAIPLSAGATFLLAIAAFWAIWQNYRFRKEEKEINVKSRALDEINDWIKEAYQMTMFSGSPNRRDRMALRQQITHIVRDSYYMSHLSRILGEEFGEKVDAVVGSIIKVFEVMKGDAILSPENKEHTKLVENSVGAILELMEIIVKTKADLFVSGSSK